MGAAVTTFPQLVSAAGARLDPRYLTIEERLDRRLHASETPNGVLRIFLFFKKMMVF